MDDLSITTDAQDPYITLLVGPQARPLRVRHKDAGGNLLEVEFDWDHDVPRITRAGVFDGWHWWSLRPGPWTYSKGPTPHLTVKLWLVF